MNYNYLTEICNNINYCPNWKNNNIDCGRDITSNPKTVEIRDSQKILLITRDPSNQANKLSSVTNFENSFFRDKVLPILFEDYHVITAKRNRDYFDTFKEKFLELFYWTHYQKCFPGKNNKTGGHKQPKAQCAKKYLRKEIMAAEPEYIIAMGSKAIKFVTGKSLLDSILQNENNSVLLAGRMIPVISITHPSNANASKSNPAYKYEESIGLIQNIVKQYS